MSNSVGEEGSTHSAMDKRVVEDNVIRERGIIEI